MLELVVQSWLVLTLACLALLTLVVAAQWTVSQARRVGAALRGSLQVRPATPLYQLPGHVNRG